MTTSGTISQNWEYRVRISAPERNNITYDKGNKSKLSKISCTNLYLLVLRYNNGIYKHIYITVLNLLHLMNVGCTFQSLH